MRQGLGLFLHLRAGRFQIGLQGGDPAGLFVLRGLCRGGFSLAGGGKLRQGLGLFLHLCAGRFQIGLQFLHLLGQLIKVGQGERPGVTRQTAGFQFGQLILNRFKLWHGQGGQSQGHRVGSCGQIIGKPGDPDIAQLLIHLLRYTGVRQDFALDHHQLAPVGPKQPQNDRCHVLPVRQTPAGRVTGGKGGGQGPGRALPNHRAALPVADRSRCGLCLERHHHISGTAQGLGQSGIDPRGKDSQFCIIRHGLPLSSKRAFYRSYFGVLARIPSRNQSPVQPFAPCPRA